LKYWAFISYSHSDTRTAKALQRALETYRLPRWLAGTNTAAGEVPAFVKPVFRDRDEMQAGADLKATVREALEQSRWLIVVCSPEAARSPWVNREIMEFKKLHGEARVLAVIAAGEPFASRLPGRETEECFPEALRFALTPEGLPQGEALEPIAADLRPQGDGAHLAMLKLVAGMVGVGVDELVRRDAQRRARRMAAIAAASLAGMAVMAVLTVMAVQSRNEAQSQRAQAEDLIEFMLGDLRKKLDPVGRLDVLDAVGEKALGYYAKQDTDRLDANSLGHRSRAMHLIGETRERRGKLDEALAAFQSAADTTAQLLARSTDDGQRIFDHAQSVYWVGYIAWRRGLAQAAEEAFLKYRELAQQLIHIDANNLDWQLEVASASHNLGVVQLDRRRLPEALQSFSESKNGFLRLTGGKPALAFELADTHGWIAKTFEASGDYSGALRAQQERLEVLRAMTDSAKDRRVQQQIANASHELGRLHLYLGNPLAAEQHARTATEQADALVSSDPANLFWLGDSCGNRLSLTEIEFALGKRELAHTNLDRAVALLSRLIASDGSVMNWQIKYGRGLALNARFALAEGRRLPTANIEAYLAKVGRFESQGKQLSADQVRVVADVGLALGDLLDDIGRREAAGAHWRAVVERLHPQAENQNHPVLTLLARAQLRLGQLAEARASAARVQASNYRHPAYADLVNELAQAAGAKPVQFKTRE
jgi:tetratricopeptide (TPR) repeat protein